MNISTFVNRTEMVSLGSLVRTVGWITAVWAFTYVGCQLLLSGDEKLVAWGFQLAIAVLSGLGLASGIGAVNKHTVRHTAKEYVEAKAKGEALATAEHSALPAVRVEAKDQSTVEIKTENGYADGVKEANHQPTEPNIYRDDERGE